LKATYLLYIPILSGLYICVSCEIL